MIDNFGFLEGVPLILEQTLPDKFFGTSTVPTTIHGRAIYHIRMASSDHVFEPPTPHPTNWVVLFYTFTALGLYRDYLFIDEMTMFTFDFDAIVSDQFK